MFLFWGIWFGNLLGTFASSSFGNAFVWVYGLVMWLNTFNTKDSGPS